MQSQDRVVLVDVDLSIEGCHKFWSKYQDANVYKAICLMEHVESWALDNNQDVNEAFIALGENIKNNTPQKISNMQDIVTLCAYIRISRKLRFMQLIDQVDPGAASRVIKYAEQNQFSSNHARFFLSRNIVFERMRIVSRMMSRDRIKMLRKLVESVP